MHRRRACNALLAVALAVALAGCDSGKLSTEADGPAPPPGTPVVREAVDGLVVGHRLMAAGQYELALRAYLRAAAEDGINVDVLSALGSANLKLGRLGQAEQLLRQALKLDPNFVPALNNLGVVLMNQGKAGEARRVFENAFALDSGQSEVIRQNLKQAIAKTEISDYDVPEASSGFSLIRRGNGRYLLLSTR